MEWFYIDMALAIAIGWFIWRHSRDHAIMESGTKENTRRIKVLEDSLGAIGEINIHIWVMNERIEHLSSSMWDVKGEVTEIRKAISNK